MLKRLFLAITVSAVFGTAFAANTDFAQCRNDFANGKPPVLSVSADMQPRSLCFSAFAVLHSGKSHTPIYVAERLNREVLLEARHNQRTNKFYAEDRLPRAERAELEDYHRSGFDRGHMAPAGDMATPESMAQSFSLANMVPQYPINNRKALRPIKEQIVVERINSIEVCYESSTGCVFLLLNFTRPRRVVMGNSLDE